MRTAVRNHNQYLFDQPKLLEGVKLEVGVTMKREPKEGESPLDLVQSDLVIWHYRYAPDEKTDWER